MRKQVALSLIGGFAVLLFSGALLGALRQSAPPIRIGVVYSLTGTMADSERPLLDAVRLGVEEINADGGLLGRRVEMVVADGQSDWPVFAAEAARLIKDQHVSAVFACWTSACRKAVKPVVEGLHHLMFYAVQYEGLEESDAIVHTGAAPNQQIIPGTRWTLDHFGRRIYLVGSDYIFPRTANRIIHDVAAIADGRILGERYVPLGSDDVGAVIDDIRRLHPDVVLNTINGDSNRPFFEGLRKAGLGDVPVMSFSVAENEMRSFGGAALTRHYATWTYFQSLDNPENKRFVAAFQARFGAQAVTSDPVEAIYVAVRLWAQAVREAGSDDPGRVNRTILRQSMNAPSGIVTIDPATRHLWKMVRIGKVRPDGQFQQVAATDDPVRPAPFPFYRDREDWNAITAALTSGTAP